MLIGEVSIKILCYLVIVIMLNEEALLMLWHSDVKGHTGLEKLVVVVYIARYSGKNIQMMLIYQAKPGGQPSCLSLW